MYEVFVRNPDAKVTVNARDLHDLISVAQGYTMKQGGFLDKNTVIRELQESLYETDYEQWGESLLIQKGWNFVVNPEALP